MPGPDQLRHPSTRLPEEAEFECRADCRLACSGKRFGATCLVSEGKLRRLPIRQKGRVSWDNLNEILGNALAPLSGRQNSSDAMEQDRDGRADALRATFS